MGLVVLHLICTIFFFLLLQMDWNVQQKSQRNPPRSSCGWYPVECAYPHLFRANIQSLHQEWQKPKVCAGECRWPNRKSSRLQNHPGRVEGKPPNYSLKDSNTNLVSSAQSDTVQEQCRMYWISFQKGFCKKKKEHWASICQQDKLINVGTM